MKIFIDDNTYIKFDSVLIYPEEFSKYSYIISEKEEYNQKSLRKLHFIFFVNNQRIEYSIYQIDTLSNLQKICKNLITYISKEDYINLQDTNLITNLSVEDILKEKKK
jgi:hypothetical protein